MADIILRGALFAGLVLHKAVWEIMKRGRPALRPQASPKLALRLTKLAKICALGFLVVQTLFLSVLPISHSPAGLQAIGVLLFVSGLSVALAGRIALGQNWSDIEDTALDSDHQIISSGVYRLIRHPIYTGDMIMVAGLELSLNSWLVLAVVPLFFYVFYRTTIEEAQLRNSVPGYGAYQMRTKRFIPFLV